MNYTLLLILILCFSLFTLKSLVIDPDLGWHLEMGKYILAHGIPQTDPFSYSMPSYPTIDHAWLTDVITAHIFKTFGMLGIAIFFATIAIASVWIQLRRYTKIWFIPSLILAGNLLFVVGSRPQVMSWLFFSLLLLFLKNTLSWGKIGLIGGMFVLWANMHASSPVGLLFIVGYIVAEYQKHKTVSLQQRTMIVLATIATFLTPYGIRLWKEIWITLTQQEKMFLLMDWYPGILVPYFAFWLSSILSLYFMFRFKYAYTSLQKILFVPFLSLALASSVEIPYWALFSFAILQTGYDQVQKSPSHFLHRKFFRYATIALICLQILPLFHQYPYPEKAVAYLRAHPTQGNVFTDFNWGGYLVWQLPEKKIFIDGQMSNWKQTNPPKRQSANALNEYLAVTSGAISVNAFTQKYQITTLIIPPRFAGWERQLAEGKWKTIYQDDTARIYQRK